MTENVNIQILEALGYWNAEPRVNEAHVRAWLEKMNDREHSPYTPAQIESAAQYAIKNRLNMEGTNE